MCYIRGSLREYWETQLSVHPIIIIDLKSLQRVYRISRGEKEKRERRPAADHQGGRKSSKGEVQESKIMAQIAKDTLFSHISFVTHIKICFAMSNYCRYANNPREDGNYSKTRKYIWQMILIKSDIVIVAMGISELQFADLCRVKSRETWRCNENNFHLLFTTLALCI